MSYQLFEVPEIRNYHLADYQYEVITNQIKDFESLLDDDKEIALKLTNFGQNIIMNIDKIGYSNPSLIHYYGYVNGDYAQLTQHISQINFLLTTVERKDKSKPPRRIGFDLSRD